jgi:hypothetical protein
MTIYIFGSNNSEKMKKARKIALDKSVAIFGWSWDSAFDLNNTTNWSYYGKAKFLKNIKSGDKIIYVHYNSNKDITEDHYGDCTIMNVVGEYSFNTDIVSICGDFGHSIPIDTNSIISFNRNDAAVHPLVSKSLKPRSSYQRLYSENELNESLNNIKIGTAPNYFINEINSIMDKIPDIIQAHHPDKILEKFMQPILEKIYSNQYDDVDIKINGSGWGTDYGADLIISYKENLEDLAITKEHIAVAQVKSYKWSINDDKAIEQCITAMQTYNAEYALLITTASTSEDFTRKIDEYNLNDKSLGKISLIDGKKVAQLFIKYIR